MAGSKSITYEIGIDAGDAVGSLRTFSGAVRAAMKDVEGELDDSATAGDKLAAALDQIAGQTREQFASAAIAAERLGTALKDAGSGLNVADVLPQLQKMGLSFDEITQDADKLAVSLKGLDDVKLAGVKDLDETAPGLSSKLEDVSKSADSSKSALANMIGNSAQDLGALGGAAGSTGVAIGQMAEYFADAAFEGEGLGSVIKNFAGVAGPILVLTAAVSAVTGAISAQQQRTERAAQTTDEFGKAMAGAADDGVGLEKALRDSAGALEKFDASQSILGSGLATSLNDAGKAIPLIGKLFQDTSVDVTKALSDAGLSLYDFTSAIAGGDATRKKLKSDLDAFNAAGFITSDQFHAATQAVDEMGKGYDDAQSKLKLYNVDQKEANALLGELTKQNDPLSQMQDTWATLFSDMADGSIDTKAAADAVNELAAGLGLTQDQVIGLARQHLGDQMKAAADATDKARQAADEYAKVVGSTDWGNSTIQAAVSGYQKLAEAQFGLIDINSNTQAAYDDLNQAIKDNGFQFDVATEKGRKNQAAIETLYSSILPQLASSFADAGGNVDKFASNMDTLRSQVFEQLDTQTGLTKDQINDVINRLGVFDGSTYSSTFEMLGVQDANAKLALLSGVLASLPPDVQRQVTLDIIAGDPEKALAEIQASVSSGPQPEAELGVNTNPAFKGLAEWSDKADGTTATATVNADTKPAATAVTDAKRTADNTTGTVKIDASTAIAAAALLAFVAQSRVANVFVNTPNINAANAQLNALTGARTAPIYAEAVNVAEANRQLNAIANQQRTARIDVNVVPTSVLVRVNGGG